MRATVKTSLANVLDAELVHLESRQSWVGKVEDEAEMVSSCVGDKPASGLLKQAVGG